MANFTSDVKGKNIIPIEIKSEEEFAKIIASERLFYEFPSLEIPGVGIMGPAGMNIFPIYTKDGTIENSCMMYEVLN